MINPGELIFCVDENNNPIEPQLKTYAHEKGIWHRNSHIWMHNGKGEILCHQRTAMVKINPLKWEPFFGGHSAPSATALETAVAELHEETGLATSGDKLHLIQLYKCLHEHEFISVYTYEFKGYIEELQAEEEEVLSLRWYDIDTLRQVYASTDPTWSHLGYEVRILEVISSITK